MRKALIFLILTISFQKFCFAQCPAPDKIKIRQGIYIMLLFIFSISQSWALKLTVAPALAAFTSVQAAMNAANAGDTIWVKTGTYNEAVIFPRSGSALNGYITLIGEAGSVLNGTGKGQLGISISSKNYIKVIGMEIQNFKGTGTPIGISIDGSSSNLEIRNNKVHNIENANGNAHGIAFYGTSATPISNIIVDGNEIRNCLLGQSESMVFNGNVTTFTVSNNTVHDNDNIGIDFIGFEGTGPTGSDQARNGICVNNTVYNISSLTNPTYGGGRSADGIYVDGGSNITIERNTVYNCDIGIELASEHFGKNTQNITVRNNFISGSYQANIMAGGYTANRGNSVNISIVNNTTYKGTGGELALQFNCSNITIKNNIFYAKAGQNYLQEWGTNNTDITVNNNLYFGESNTSAGTWGDANAKYTNPQLVSAPTNMHLTAISPAIDAGLNLGNDGTGNPLSGILDIDNLTRVVNGIIDIGANEYDISLPIGLLNFNATTIENEYILVQWQNAWELNNHSIELQRCLDLTSDTWLILKVVNGDGNSSVLKSYAYNDSLHNVTTYYRLKPVDENGHYKYSSVICVSPNPSISILTVYPNPAQNNLQIQLASPLESICHYNVFDQLGRVVLHGEHMVYVGRNMMTIDISILLHGSYILQLINSTEITDLHFLKE